MTQFSLQGGLENNEEKKMLCPLRMYILGSTLFTDICMYIPEQALRKSRGVKTTASCKKVPSLSLSLGRLS